jgi:outer membrane protein W
MVATFSTKPSDGYTVSSVLYKVKWALATPTNTAVRLATAAVLPNTPTYSNGTLGVGATLTAGSNTTLTVDGATVALNDRVLVKTQASAFQNGLYVCTQAGSGSVPWILTRATDCDQAVEVLADILVATTAGTANTGKQFLHHGAVIVMGTDAINWEAGEPVGTWSFEISANSTNGLDGDFDPIDLTGTGIVQPAGTASSIAIRIGFTCMYVRATYTPTTGTGVANVYVIAGGPR